MKRFIALLLLAFALFAPFALAASFDFAANVNVTGTVFLIPERSNFSYDINVTVTESLVRYSRQLTNLTLSINNASGEITYTPGPDEIGYHAEGVIFISENVTNGLEFITIKYFFNVTNVNDAPNISTKFPSDLNHSMLENSTLLFNITATDPDLAYGDVMNVSWYLDGGLVQQELRNVTYNSIFNFTATFCNASAYNVTVIVRDLADLTSELTWNLTVNNTNRPPQFNSTIFNLTWYEDTNLLNNLTLDQYFYDPDAAECSGVNQDNLSFVSNLTYGVGGNANINVSIDQGSSNASFYPAANFVGNESIVFVANDSYAIAQSNPINLTVLNVNDAPVLSSIGNLTAGILTLYTSYHGTVDPDLIYGDNLTWQSNATIFNLTKYNSTHAAINFTPSIADIGNYSIIINVTDTNNVSDFEVIIFTVQNNSAPVLAYIGNQSALEDVAYQLDVNATDSDGDNLTFSTNSTLFSISTINGTLGRVSFTPTNAQVGNYSISFTATDSYGATDTRVISLNISNVNDAPVLDNITTLTVKVNRTLLYNVTATDVDILWGDNLTFTTNTSLFNLSKFNATAALLNYSPIVADVGNHSILVNVTDSDGVVSNRTFLLVVLNSSVPMITYIGNHTIAENAYLNLTINITETDGDVLTFLLNSTTLNVSVFNFTNVTGTQLVFNGTPDQEDVGNHTFRLNVTDVDGNTDIEEFTLFVTYVDDTPYFLGLSTLQVNENALLLTNISAYDEELERFGAVINLTFYTNTSLFTLTNRTNASSVLLNFTPTSMQVGNYSINFTVSDGNSNSSQTVLLMVINVNDPPQIAAFGPVNLTPQDPENQTFTLSVNATDPDMPLGDNLSIIWLLDGANQTSVLSTFYNDTNATFTLALRPGFCTNGTHNLTAKVMDRSNVSVSIQWNLTITNVNRLPEYGIKRHTTPADFANGSLANTSYVNSTGNVTLALYDDTHYDSAGNFTSQIIDFGSKFRFSADLNVTHVQRLEWEVTQPAGTNLSMYYRTSLDGVSFTNWTGPYLGSPEGVLPNTVRYLQYRAEMSASSDALSSPILREVRVKYTIANLTVVQNTRYTNIINLMDYFTDEDTAQCNGPNKDDLNGWVQGNSSTLLSFDDSVITIIEHGTYAGVETLQFTGNDSHNVTIGDDVVFTVEESLGGSIPSSSTSTSSSGGGGGSSSSVQIQQDTKIKNVTVPLALDIIVPKPLVVYNNESVSVPISLVNNENFSLFDIHLRASVPNGSISYSYSTDYVRELKPDETVDTTLLIRAFKSLGTYEIVVFANVSDPEYEDKASFFVSSIEQGTTNDSQFNTRITFARDLVAQSPECLELQEQVERAADAASKGDINGADAILQQTINDCRYLLSLSDSSIEQPEGLPLSIQIKRFVENPLFIAFLIVTGLLGGGYFVYRQFTGTKGLPKRKLSPEEEEIAAILGIKKRK